MAISSLDRIINTTLLTKISRTSTSAPSSPLSSPSSQELSGQALYDSLRGGAQNFAAGMQLLNGSASFVNVSLDTTEKLLEMVVKLETITSKANRGNISSSVAKQMRSDFDSLATEFDEIVEKATEDDQNFFDTEKLQAVLTRSGLDPEKVRELASALKRFTSPGEPTIGADGEVTSDGSPVPLVDFQRALRAAIVDPDDPSDDRSGFFGKVRNKLKDIRIQLETNVKALKDTAELIGDNMQLVRAAGLAFLEVSNEMTGAETAEEIAEQLRQQIRSTARQYLGQAHNLEPIMVAGLAALSESSEGE